MNWEKENNLDKNYAVICAFNLLLFQTYYLTYYIYKRYVAKIISNSYGI